MAEESSSNKELSNKLFQKFLNILDSSFSSPTINFFDVLDNLKFEQRDDISFDYPVFAWIRNAPIMFGIKNKYDRYSLNYLIALALYNLFTMKFKANTYDELIDQINLENEKWSNYINVPSTLLQDGNVFAIDCLVPRNVFQGLTYLFDFNMLHNYFNIPLTNLILSSINYFEGYYVVFLYTNSKFRFCAIRVPAKLSPATSRDLFEVMKKTELPGVIIDKESLGIPVLFNLDEVKDQLEKEVIGLNEGESKLDCCSKKINLSKLISQPKLFRDEYLNFTFIKYLKIPFLNAQNNLNYPTQNLNILWGTFDPENVLLDSWYKAHFCISRPSLDNLDERMKINPFAIEKESWLHNLKQISALDFRTINAIISISIKKYIEKISDKS